VLGACLGCYLGRVDPERVDRLDSSRCCTSCCLFAVTSVCGELKLRVGKVERGAEKGNGSTALALSLIAKRNHMKTRRSLTFRTSTVLVSTYIV
jgi:hypothetical protein